MNKNERQRDGGGRISGVLLRSKAAVSFHVCFDIHGDSSATAIAVKEALSVLIFWWEEIL